MLSYIDVQGYISEPWLFNEWLGKIVPDCTVGFACATENNPLARYLVSHSGVVRAYVYSTWISVYGSDGEYWIVDAPPWVIKFINAIDTLPARQCISASAARSALRGAIVAKGVSFADR